MSDQNDADKNDNSPQDIGVPVTPRRMPKAPIEPL